jgi:hypothetical protein
MTGGTVSHSDSPSNILSAQVRRTAIAGRFELDRTRVWVLDGHWYPRLTVLREASLNSNFVFGTGWWAENGA